MQTGLFLLLIACGGQLSGACPLFGARPAWPATLTQPHVTPAPTILQSPDGQKTTWEDLLHRYRGKVVYLDLWASWCGPCREQTPYYASLKGQFDKDSVVFLSVSIDAEPGDWQEALRSLGLQGDANTFLLLDGRHSALNNALHIKGVPRYALLDRNGNMTDKDAPFPSDPKIAARIRALMQKVPILTN
jgi:thiol-disulfide isomerase/thioredoxin